MAITKEKAILAKTDIEEWETSFHFHVLNTSKKKLCQILGEADYDDNSNAKNEKVTVEWLRELKLGDKKPFVFLIYDWKEYRKYSETANIEFHIGTYDETESGLVQNILTALLNGQTESQLYVIENTCIK